MSPAQFVVIAGVNGAGKSTLTALKPEELALGPVLDPDAVARTLNPVNYKGSAIEAAKQVLTEARSCIDQQRSFAVETTLSGHTYLRLLKLARQQGFRTRLLYVGLASPEISLERVRIRVSLGGHDVPEEDIRRRYSRSLSNLALALPLTDAATLFDNSTVSGYETVALADHGEIAWVANPIPAWAAHLQS